MTDMGIRERMNILSAIMIVVGAVLFIETWIFHVTNTRSAVIVIVSLGMIAAGLIILAINQQ